ncbi:hypothetical protein Pelo_19330 [Pelomyxa schiedti]|nr:hypothetical protein Pelo_19330 [Pelomyxa schiedti]
MDYTITTLTAALTSSSVESKASTSAILLVDAAWQLCKSALKTTRILSNFLLYCCLPGAFAFPTEYSGFMLITPTYSCRISSCVVQGFWCLQMI